MVLVSHIYKFIYLKNFKVAGSSVESFFGEFCVDPNTRKNYPRTDAIDELISSYGIVGKRLEGKGSKWMNHKPASLVKYDLGNETFDQYFKFAVVRNPWDAVVSDYFWRRSKLPFKEFVKQQQTIDHSWYVHTINDVPICDFYIRYENLHADIEAVCKKLGITDYDLKNLPHHKAKYRKKKNIPYTSYYDDETKELVAKIYKKHIDYFGYKFGD